jgi:large conductance mechanosensitive channel
MVVYSTPDAHHPGARPLEVWTISTGLSVGFAQAHADRGLLVKSLMDEFKAFLLRGNVVDLAVAVVIGAAFGAVVSALVKDLITPLIAAIGKAPDFSGIYFTVNNSKFFIGDFINVVISFIILAAVIFFLVVKPINYLMAHKKEEAPGAPTTRQCPYCISDIPLGATRCAYCTQEVPVLETANVTAS